MVTSVSPFELKTRARESARISTVSSPIRSSASSVSPQSAPRGTASFNGPPRRARGASTACGVIACPSSEGSLLRPRPGRAVARPLIGRAPSRQAFLLHLGEVHPLQVEAESRRRHGSAEAADQLVVAPTAAEDVAEGG